MKYSQISKKSWFNWALVALAFIVLATLVSTTVIFTHPKPLHFYLELLNKNSHRNQNITTYTREEFAVKFLGATTGTYQAGDFNKLFDQRYNNPIAKENTFFKVYQFVNKDNSCQVDIFGISKKNNLVYVSFRNICASNYNGHK
jgi:hypothetical protein